MRVRFVSDSSVRKTGFAATMTCVAPASPPPPPPPPPPPLLPSVAAMPTAYCTGPHEQIKQLGEQSLCSCEPHFKLTATALAIEKTGQHADYFHTKQTMCEEGGDENVLVNPWVLTFGSMFISSIFGFGTCICTVTGRGSRDTDLFIFVELLDSFLDICTFVWADTEDGLFFSNDPVGVIRWSLGISVCVSVATFLVEVIVRWKANDYLTNALPILLSLHIVFEDGFQMLCYGGVTASHSKRAPYAVWVAALQSFCFFVTKTFEMSRKNQVGFGDDDDDDDDDYV
jgi:hypothetical protein